MFLSYHQMAEEKHAGHSLGEPASVWMELPRDRAHVQGRDRLPPHASHRLVRQGQGLLARNEHVGKTLDCMPQFPHLVKPG